VIDLQLMWEQLNRVCKLNAAIVLYGMEPFSSALRMSNIKNYKYDWKWKKSKASNFPHAPNMPLKILEDVMIFSNGSIGHVTQLGDKRVPYNPQGTRKGTTVVKQNKNTSELNYHRDSQTNHTSGYKCKREGYPNSLLEFKSDNGLHPTQKPVKLMEYLIATYTNEGETVLDFAMGSGTTGVACKNLNRQFIGIEKDSEYFNIAKERIESI